MIWLGTDIERSVRQSLFELVPSVYKESKVVTNIIETDAKEIERLYAAINDVMDQFFVTSATWGLSYWERVLGLATVPTKSVEERRSLIIARLRGASVATIPNVKAIAEAFYGGEIDVIEDYANYTAYFKFKSNLGVPPNEDDVRKVLRDIMPAHIAFEFLYTFLLIREIHGVKTLNEMEQIPLSQFAGA